MINDNFCIVLHQPRDVKNIGGVIRAMKNMGFQHLRLVAPVAFDAADVRGIAHRSDDIIATARTYTSLDAALADVTYVVGTTARTRGKHTLTYDVRGVARDLLQRVDAGPVALLFGPEDNGLDNDALDRCHTILSLPIDPAYASLNLAQAALLVMYEVRMATDLVPPASVPAQPPATIEQLSHLYAAVEQALHAVEFVKSGSTKRVMRSVRQLVQRAQPNQTEAALLTAMAREVVAFLRRKGLS